MVLGHSGAVGLVYMALVCLIIEVEPERAQNLLHRVKAYHVMDQIEKQDHVFLWYRLIQQVCIIISKDGAVASARLSVQKVPISMT